MRDVPKITDLDMAFGNIKHMPKFSELPDEFRRFDHTPESDFVSKWFGAGLKQDDLDRLTPRDGVDTKAALRAIGAILRSFDPKHEHKIGGAAFLLREWFDLAPEKKAKSA